MANRDAKLIRLRMKHGLEGYGLYWYLLELIVNEVQMDHLTFQLEHDSELIAHDLNLHQDKVQDIMRDMIELGLFENHDGVITCQKLARRLDTSMTSNPKMRQALVSYKQGQLDGVKMESGQSHDCIMQEENRREEINSPPDDGRWSRFWSVYPRKEAKKKAMTAFRRLKAKDQEAAIADLESGRFSGADKKFIPLPTTYINGERWHDELAKPADSYGSGLA
jgi:hypothetical protein